MLTGLLLVFATPAIAADLTASATVAQDASDPIPAEDRAEGGYPITLDGEVLFHVTSTVGPFTPRERAERAERKLELVAEDPFFSKELFDARLEAGEGRLYYRGELVGVVTAADAKVEGRTIEEELARRVESVLSALHRYRERRLPAQLTRATLLVAVDTGALALVLVLLARLHRRFRAGAGKPRKGLLGAVEQRLRASRSVLDVYEERSFRWMRGLVTIVAVVVYLQVLFALIPLTRSYAIALLEYVEDPFKKLGEALLAHVGDLFFIAVVVLLTHFTLKLMRLAARESENGSIVLPGIEADNAMRLYKVLRLIVIAIAVVVVFPYVPGSESPAFRGLSLLFGALLTIGSSSTAGNLVGGVVLVFSRLFRVGDRVRIGEVEGDIVDIDLLMTRVQTPKNELVSIPNGTILSGHVVNFSANAAGDGLILHTSVTIGYDTPWRLVHELLLSAARQSEGVVLDPAPFVLQSELSDFYVAYELNAYTREPRRKVEIYSRLHQNIQDEFNAHGVQIMSPHYLSDPAAPKVVPPGSFEALRAKFAPAPRAEHDGAEAETTVPQRS